MAQGSLVKKGDRYYGVFYVGSEQVWRTLKTSVEREAHKRLREVMRSLDTGRYRENRFSDVRRVLGTLSL
jgi:hypothetical protein